MSLEDDILIEQYLKNVLSDEQKAAFDQRLQNDAEFREAFLLEKQMFESLNEDSWSTIDRKDSDLVKDYTKEFEGEEFQNIKENINRAAKTYHDKETNLNKWMVYALVASIVLALFLWNPFRTSSTPEQLYTNYVALDELPSLVDRNQSQNKLATAQAHFENKEYEQAQVLFEEALLKNPSNANLYLYLGLSQTELDQFDNAVNTFDRLINSDLIDSPKGIWYKALALLKKGDLEKTKSLLNDLIEDGSFMQSQAQELVKELD